MISLVEVRYPPRVTPNLSPYRRCPCVGGMNMGEGIRHFDTTSKRFVDTQTRQLLVDYPFLVHTPSNL